MTSPPVVLVHGFGTSYDLTWVHNGWADLLADEGREVIGVDLLGHGTAPKPTAVDAYDDLGERVVAALPSEGPVDAVGFSMGARTLLGVAAAHPERFRRLVIAGIGANLFVRSDHGPVVDAIRTGDDGGDPHLRYFADLATLPGNNREALAACMANVGAALTVEDLGRITCPVLVVLGDQDFTRPADALVAALPDASFVELPRTDHAKTPKSFAFIDAALDFLRD